MTMNVSLEFNYRNYSDSSDKLFLLHIQQKLYIADILYSGHLLITKKIQIELPCYNGHIFRERIDQKPHMKPLLGGHLLIAETFSGSRWCPL